MDVRKGGTDERSKNISASLYSSICQIILLHFKCQDVEIFHYFFPELWKVVFLFNMLTSY